MDASTAAAVAALVVAVAAFLIAFAQVLQQYFITGQSIRICDNVVFGEMPGKGRRIWQASQFRFRVVYSIPQICLPNSLWPQSWPQSFKEGKHCLPNLSGNVTKPDDFLWQHLLEDMIGRSAFLQDKEKDDSRSKPFHRFWSWKQAEMTATGPRVGEAAWVSFCRIIHYSCRSCVRYDFVEGDADRCPPDLPTVPMQLSLRDVIIMALTVGMYCTEASFPKRILSMQGVAGIITTSQHPVLGPLLHFIPGNMKILHGIPNTGIIWIPWIYRVLGYCPVAGAPFSHRERRSIEKYEGVWIHRIKTSSTSKRNLAASSKSTRTENDGRRKVVVIPSEESQAVATLESRPLSQRKGVHDGDWLLVEESKSLSPLAPQAPRSIKLPDNMKVTQTGIAPHQGKRLSSQESQPLQEGSKAQKATTPYQATVEPDDSTSQVHLHDLEVLMNREVVTSTDLSGQIPDIRSSSIPVNGEASRSPDVGTHINPEMKSKQQEARERQAERNKRAAEVVKDQLTVEKIEKEGRMPRTKPGQLLLMWKTDTTDDKPTIDQERDGSESKGKKHAGAELPPTSEEREALDREAKRKEERDKRERERSARSTEQSRVAGTFGKMNWFWLSQTDIIPGFWATPWRSFDPLDGQSCAGAVTAILSALTGFTDSTNLRYVTSWQLGSSTANWLLQGKVTFPGYAHNSRAGVVCSGTYPAVRFDVFKEPVPAIELLRSYEHQVSRERASDQNACEEGLLELMRLDAWLSLCGRTNEILLGRNDLIKQTSAMVQLLLEEFEIDFLNLDLSDVEGGMQDNQALATNIMDFLLDEELSGAEQLFVLVATLRTVKVGQAILQGQDTQMLQDMLMHDIQVHLV